MRAFRPSHFAREQDRQEDIERIKFQNVMLYAKRAQAGLPLFGPPAEFQGGRTGVVEPGRASLA
jgi:hypothetical protein